MASAGSHTSNVLAKTTDLQVVSGHGCRVTHCLREHRVILMTAGTRNRTVRWMPRLVVTSDEVNEATQAFAAAIRATG